MVRISVLAHKFRGERSKKGLQRETVSFVLAFTGVFPPGTRIYSRLGEQAVFWGTRLRNAPRGAGPVYGHESCVLTKRVRSQVQVSEKKFLRRIEGVTLFNKMRSSEIQKSLNIEPLLLRIKRSQLRW